MVNVNGAPSGYMSGFGNEFATEAVVGALPIGRNSPQRPPLGLYAEQLSGTAFTAPRNQNRRSWLYRLQPSAVHRSYHAYAGASALRSGPFNDIPAPPNRLRWDPLPFPETPTDFVDGLHTIAGNGDPMVGLGNAAHIYCANKSMERRVFFNSDGEMLIVPQLGALTFVTELGRIDVTPGEIVVIPRGVRFSVLLIDAQARGYVCENYGAMLRLPELGPIGSNCLANPRDFLAPVAAFVDEVTPTECLQKFGGRLWTTMLDASPFDVVAWHGNYAPYKYDLARYNPIGTISFDHPDPSIYTVLTSPSEIPGTANVDFVIFPPRWLVAEDTFRPPWFHRNVMSEFMGLIHGVYDSKQGGGFEPGSASLHNCMSAHGPDRTSHTRATEAKLVPQKIDNSLAFMFESRWNYRPTRAALEGPQLQKNYDDCWSGFTRASIAS